MRDLSDFLRYVLPHAAACADVVAEHYIRFAAQQFCMRTRMWRETDEFTTVADDIEVLCVPPYAALHEVEEAWFNGSPLEPARFDHVFGPDPVDGDPKWITQAGPDRLSLHPPGAGTLRVSMFLKPAEDADVLPDFLFDHHATTIGWGALREIKLLPNQPFSDSQMSVFFGERFDRAVNKHFTSNIRGQHRARGNAGARYF